MKANLNAIMHMIFLGIINTAVRMVMHWFKIHQKLNELLDHLKRDTGSPYGIEPRVANTPSVSWRKNRWNGVGDLHGNFPYRAFSLLRVKKCG
jgi:hypothetical protein